MLANSDADAYTDGRNPNALGGLMRVRVKGTVMGDEEREEQAVNVPTATELMWPTFQVMMDGADGQPMPVEDIDLRVADMVGLGQLGELPQETNERFRTRMRQTRTYLGPKIANLIDNPTRGQWQLVEGAGSLPSSEEELHSIYLNKKREYNRKTRANQRRTASEEEQAAQEQAGPTAAEEEGSTPDEDVSDSVLAAETPPGGTEYSDRLTRHVRQLADDLRERHRALIEEQYQLRMELQKLRERASDLEQHLNENRAAASHAEQEFHQVKDDLEQVGVQIPPLEH